MENKLEQLLLTKKFGELTPEEKYYVTEYLEEAEYDRMHIFLKNSQSAINNSPILNTVLKEKLIAAFRQKHGVKEAKKPTTIARLVCYRIPVWQMAAAIALLIGLHFWLQAEPPVAGKTETVYVHSIDTIYKEVAMQTIIEKVSETPPVRVNVKPKVQQPLPEKEPTIVASLDSASHYNDVSNMPDSFNLMVSHPRGKSVTQTADLWQLLEEVY